MSLLHTPRGTVKTSYTLHQLAAKIEVAPNTIWRWLRRGLMPHGRKRTIFLKGNHVGGSWRITQEDFDAFCAARTPTPGENLPPELLPRSKAKQQAADRRADKKLRAEVV